MASKAQGKGGREKMRERQGRVRDAAAPVCDAAAAASRWRPAACSFLSSSPPPFQPPPNVPGQDRHPNPQPGLRGLWGVRQDTRMRVGQCVTGCVFRCCCCCVGVFVAVRRAWYSRQARRPAAGAAGAACPRRRPPPGTCRPGQVRQVPVAPRGQRPQASCQGTPPFLSPNLS